MLERDKIKNKRLLRMLDKLDEADMIICPVCGKRFKKTCNGKRYCDERCRDTLRNIRSQYQRKFGSKK